MFVNGGISSPDSVRKFAKVNGKYKIAICLLWIDDAECCYFFLKAAVKPCGVDGKRSKYFKPECQVILPIRTIT